MKPPDVDRKGRPHTQPAADPATLEPWLARDRWGGLVLLVGTCPVAYLTAGDVAILKQSAGYHLCYQLMLRECGQIRFDDPAAPTGTFERAARETP
jgi:hypothetical protein